MTSPTGDGPTPGGWRVSWSPASAFERTFAEHGDLWPDHLEKIEPVAETREQALAYIERIGSKALHGHFVLTEFETDEQGEERELSREVIEAALTKAIASEVGHD